MKTNKNIAREKLIMLVAIVAILIVSVKLVVERQADRGSIGDMQKLKSEISLLENHMASMQGVKQVDLVKDSWNKFLQLASDFPVSVGVLKSDARQFDVGDMNAWHGVLKGDILDVLVLAKISQTLVPVKFHLLDSGSSQATLVFSVIGRRS